MKVTRYSESVTATNLTRLQVL